MTVDAELLGEVLARPTHPLHKMATELLLKGDVAGHEFHGNQYSGGMGAREAANRLANHGAKANDEAKRVGSNIASQHYLQHNGSQYSPPLSPRPSSNYRDRILTENGRTGEKSFYLRAMPMNIAPAIANLTNGSASDRETRAVGQYLLGADAHGKLDLDNIDTKGAGTPEITKEFHSKAQWRWGFAGGLDPDQAREWADATPGGYDSLPDEAPVTKGDSPGHPFRGNQYGGSSGGGKDVDTHVKVINDLHERVAQKGNDFDDGVHHGIAAASGIMGRSSSPEAGHDEIEKIKNEMVNNITRPGSGGPPSSISQGLVAGLQVALGESRALLQAGSSIGERLVRPIVQSGA